MELACKPIDRTKTYVLRDGEEYDVQITHLAERLVIANVRCLNTGRSATINYEPDGMLRRDEKPHALDLIDRMDWDQSIRMQDQPLPQVGDLLRFRLDTDKRMKIVAKVMKVGEGLTDNIEVRFFGEDDGRDTHVICQYAFDGTILGPGGDANYIGVDQPMDLVQAYMPYETWERGDPLFVQVKSSDGTGDFQWRRARFLNYDQITNCVRVTTGTMHGEWSDQRTGPQIYNAWTSVRVPNKQDIQDLKDLWPQSEARDAIAVAARRMNRSNPYWRRDPLAIHYPEAL